MKKLFPGKMQHLYHSYQEVVLFDMTEILFPSFDCIKGTKIVFNSFMQLYICFLGADFVFPWEQNLDFKT